MFYSEVLLVKKGALAHVWLAAHSERKLKKQQINACDLVEAADKIQNPEAQLAIRLSGQLLLGLSRIYARKVKYLQDDAADAHTKLKAYSVTSKARVDARAHDTVAADGMVADDENDLDLNHDWLDELDPEKLLAGASSMTSVPDRFQADRKAITMQDDDWTNTRDDGSGDQSSSIAQKGRNTPNSREADDFGLGFDDQGAVFEDEPEAGRKALMALEEPVELDLSAGGAAGAPAPMDLLDDDQGIDLGLGLGGLEPETEPHAEAEAEAKPADDKEDKAGKADEKKARVDSQATEDAEAEAEADADAEAEAESSQARKKKQEAAAAAKKGRKRKAEAPDVRLELSSKVIEAGLKNVDDITGPRDTVPLTKRAKYDHQRSKDSGLEALLRMPAISSGGAASLAGFGLGIVFGDPLSEADSDLAPELLDLFRRNLDGATRGSGRAVAADEAEPEEEEEEDAVMEGKAEKKAEARADAELPEPEAEPEAPAGLEAEAEDILPGPGMDESEAFAAGADLNMSAGGFDMSSFGNDESAFGFAGDAKTPPAGARSAAASDPLNPEDPALRSQLAARQRADDERFDWTAATKEAASGSGSGSGSGARDQWGPRTVKMLEFLNQRFGEKDAEGKEGKRGKKAAPQVLSLNQDILGGASTRRTAAGVFYQLLVLKSSNVIELQQDEPWADIRVTQIPA